MGTLETTVGNIGWIALGAEETKKMKKEQPTAVQMEVMVYFYSAEMKKSFLFVVPVRRNSFP